LDVRRSVKDIREPADNQGPAFPHLSRDCARVIFVYRLRIRKTEEILMSFSLRTTTGFAFALLGCAISLVVVSTSASAQPPQGRGGGGNRFTESNDPRVENRTDRFADTGEELPYCVFVSSKVSADKENPLIISLHGLGIGPGFMCQGAAIDLAEEGGYILAAPMGYSVGGWYGSPVMAGRGGRGGQNPNATPPPANLPELSEKDVLNVLAMLREEFNVDDDRTYLMGHSMGGAGTFFLGSKHADEWAALAPIAPAAMLMNDNRRAILQGIEDNGVPVHLVVGDMDNLMSTARLWAETMDELDVEHEYKEIAGADHGSVIDLAMPDIFAFFAKHTKPD
jgi:pimeloyl-ACP methyl ester carboxylesterase